ncbi:hypothetical protein [Chloroflexus aurantiacus]
MPTVPLTFFALQSNWLSAGVFRIPRHENCLLPLVFFTLLPIRFHADVFRILRANAGVFRVLITTVSRRCFPVGLRAVS